MCPITTSGLGLSASWSLVPRKGQGRSGCELVTPCARSTVAKFIENILRKDARMLADIISVILREGRGIRRLNILETWRCMQVGMMEM